VKKSNLFKILGILAFIFLLCTALICNWCSSGEEAEDLEAGDSERPGEAENEEGEVAEDGENEGDTDEKALAGDGENGVSEEEVEETAAAPTITLEIYEGPESAGNICYYRIKANVSGVPAPEVEWSRDDSNGAWGQHKAQVNINNPGNTYTLTAKATNLSGTATDSLELSWGCNRSPVISEITFMGSHYTGQDYTVSVSASDPDGDNLNYEWSTSGGIIDDIYSSSIVWTTPLNDGFYDLSVVVSDGRGGTATKTETVEVLPSQPPPVLNADLPIVTGEGGDLSNKPSVYIGSIHRVGDCLNNYAYKGVISFDITGFSGANINSAKLTASSNNQQGNLSSFKPLYILSVNWGVGQPSDFNMTGKYVAQVSYYDFICTSPELKNEIQKAIDNREQRFQIMLYFSGMLTDNDNNFDMWIYNDCDINLNIVYNP